MSARRRFETRRCAAASREGRRAYVALMSGDPNSCFISTTTATTTWRRTVATPRWRPVGLVTAGATDHRPRPLQMKAFEHKTWLKAGTVVAPLPGRDASLVVGTFVAAALISSPAVAVSPAPPPPDFFATPRTGDALWAACCSGSPGRLPLERSAYVVGIADGTALTTGGRQFCITAPVQHETLAEVVRPYIAAHPQSRSASAATVVAMALRGAYPCRRAMQR